MVANAAVVEELFFRGFLIERLIALTGRSWLAGLASYLIFVGSHIPGSGLGIVITFDVVGTAALVGLYLLRRNLYVCMLAHAVLDFMLLLG